MNGIKSPHPFGCGLLLYIGEIAIPVYALARKDREF